MQVVRMAATMVTATHVVRAVASAIARTIRNIVYRPARAISGPPWAIAPQDTDVTTVTVTNVHRGHANVRVRWNKFVRKRPAAISG